MASLTRFGEGRDKPQINTEKSVVARPWGRSFLGFTVRNDPVFRRCITDKAVARFKHRVRELKRRYRGVGLERMIADLNPFARGWPRHFWLPPVARVAIAGWPDPAGPALRRVGSVEDARPALPRASSAHGLRTVG